MVNKSKVLFIVLHNDYLKTKTKTKTFETQVCGKIKVSQIG